MLTADSLEALKAFIKGCKTQQQSLAFVPTMGNLHQGHLRLVDVARGKADKVVVSIFVNPLQFPPGSDFDKYPRTLEQDKEKLEILGVDCLFCPAVDLVYPEGMNNSTQVTVPGLSTILCGEFRAGHFDGVSTVVAKLFNMVQPDVAVFGEKDYQQLALIRQMVRDLNFDIDIVGVATEREVDGLAMSSRNQYLDDAQRKIAPMIYQVMQEVKSRIKAGDRAYTNLEKQAGDELQKAGFNPDYVRVCDAITLQAAGPESRSLRILAAAYLGPARLIDNIPV